MLVEIFLKFKCYTFIVCILTAFNIANKATPTSAIAASHKVAMPPAPKISTNTFTVMAMTIFCQTMLRVIFPILIAETIFCG